MRIFSNKSETCVLLGVSRNIEDHTIKAKMLIVFPEAPMPVALFEIFPDGSDEYCGLYIIEGSFDSNEHRMFRNVTLKEAVPHEVS
jgi:hypothetical protein